jgi:hypothetical protein
MKLDGIPTQCVLHCSRHLLWTCVRVTWSLLLITRPFISMGSWHIKKLRGSSPRAKHTDRETTDGRRDQFHPLRIEGGVAWSVRPIPIAVISVSRPEPLLFLSSGSSVVLTRLSGSRSWGTLTTRPQRRSGVGIWPLQLLISVLDWVICFTLRPLDLWGRILHPTDILWKEG